MLPQELLELLTVIRKADKEEPSPSTTWTKGLHIVDAILASEDRRNRLNCVSLPAELFVFFVRHGRLKLGANDHLFGDRNLGRFLLMLARTVRPERTFVTALIGEPCVGSDVTFAVLLPVRLAAIGAGDDFPAVLSELEVGVKRIGILAGQ